jgi:hypothetical protein
VTLAAYNGHEVLTFADYTDLDTGRTLRAEPGRTYDVAPASGRVVPEVPEPWFTPVTSGEGAPAEGDGAPETSGQEAGEPAHDEDPETDTSQQF